MFVSVTIMITGFLLSLSYIPTFTIAFTLTSTTTTTTISRRRSTTNLCRSATTTLSSNSISNNNNNSNQNKNNNKYYNNHKNNNDYVFSDTDHEHFYFNHIHNDDHNDDDDADDNDEYYNDALAHEEDLTYQTNLYIRNLVSRSIEEQSIQFVWEAEDLLLAMEEKYNVWGKKKINEEEEEEEEEEWDDDVVVWEEEESNHDDDTDADDKSKLEVSSYSSSKKEKYEDKLKLEELGPPDTVTYNMIINAYAKSNEENSSKHAERILQRMESLHEHQKYTHELWEQQQQEEQYKNDLHDSPPPPPPPPRLNVKPNVRTYSTVIDAWARATKNKNHHAINGSNDSLLSAAHHAESILHKLNKLYQQSHDVALRPNVITYNTVLNAYSKQQQAGDAGIVGGGEGEGAQRATELLANMESKDVCVTPDVISYNTVMSAWSRCGSGTVRGGEKAEEILRRMIYNAEKARMENKRRIDQADEDRKRFQEQQQRKQLKLEQQEQQQHHHHQAEEEAKKTLDNNDNDNNAPSQKNKNKKQKKRKKKRKLKLLHVIQPNARSYSIVLDAHGKSTHPKSAQRAYFILREMERLYQTTHDRRIKPNVITYSSTINAYARSRYVKHKAFKALRLLRRMEDSYYYYYNQDLKDDENEEEEKEDGVVVVKPNAHCYNAVLNACAMSFGRLEYSPTDYYYNDDNSSNNKGINEEDQEDYDDDYDEGAEEGEVAELLIGDQLINIRTTTENNDPPPPDERIIAMQIVKDLYYQFTNDDACGAKPDHFTYGTILKACANLLPTTAAAAAAAAATHPQPPISSSSTIMEEATWTKTSTIDTTIDPNQDVYDNDENMSFIRKVFTRCCKDGMVSSGVCYQLRQAATSDLYRELMMMDSSSSSSQSFGGGGGGFEHDDFGGAAAAAAAAGAVGGGVSSLWTGQDRLEDNIPKEWSRNVREQV